MLLTKNLGMSNKIKIRLAKKVWDNQNLDQTNYYLSIIDKGVEEWNNWKLSSNKEMFLDLRGANFHMKDLSGIDLSGCNLSDAVFSKCQLQYSNLSYVCGRNIDVINSKLINSNLSGSYFLNSNFNLTDFSNADLKICDLSSAQLFMTIFNNADLRKADFAGATIEEASFTGATIKNTDFEAANLRGANFSNIYVLESNFKSSILVDVDFSNSVLERCKVFGASVWRTVLNNTTQINLIVSDSDTHELTVDDLNIAQFLYTIIDNPKLRNMLDTITSKTVLILGRFTYERKLVLDKIKEHLKNRDLVPIIFDFEPPHSRDLKETIVTLAHLAKFIIADITDPKSIPMELMAIVPNLPSVPVKPIILTGEKPWAMFSALTRYPWVLSIFEYKDVEYLLANIDINIIGSAERYLMTQKTNNVGSY
jgi:uncharacterized protein YjbI with pentapeptide repeats